MVKRQNDQQEKSLITLSPKLYRHITKRLQDRYHIHSYDLQANGLKKEDGLHVIIRFGEHYNHEKEKYISNEALENDKKLDPFIKEVGEACKQVLIDDYFKKMTP